MNIYNFDGHTPKIDSSAYVSPMSYVSGRVTIEKYASIWPMVVLRGDISTIHVGQYTNIQDGTVCHVTHASEFNGHREYPLNIGDFVTIGHGAILHACTIGNSVLIGMGSTILDGSVIEDYTMIGANSLVTPSKRLEGGFLWTGSPVKKVRELTDTELKFFKYSAEYYAKLAKKTRESIFDSYSY